VLTNFQELNLSAMKRLVVLAFVLFLVWNHCSGQEIHEKNSKSENKAAPDTEIKVNKEYDEDGNIIKYDSTYSYLYSNTVKDRILIDSILNNFNKNFQQRDFFFREPLRGDPFFSDEFFSDEFFSDKFFNDRDFNDKFFGDRFLSDSLLNRDFSRKNIVPGPFMFNEEQIQKIFRKLDSLNNQIFVRPKQNLSIKL
jgi:hypothetical protein